jgi:hypothetical protein
MSNLLWYQHGVSSQLIATQHGFREDRGSVLRKSNHLNTLVSGVNRRQRQTCVISLACTRNMIVFNFDWLEDWMLCHMIAPAFTS